MWCRAERTRRRPDNPAPGRSVHRASAATAHRRSPAPERREENSPRGSGMKLLIVILSDSDADGLVRAMVERGYPATKIGTTGGFLRRGNTTLLSGIGEDEVDDVIALIRRLCPVRTELLTLGAIPIAGELPFLNEPVEVRAGGAVIFVLDIDRFERV
jgi:uncharacterized protein YaaQ